MGCEADKLPAKSELVNVGRVVRRFQIFLGLDSNSFPLSRYHVRRHLEEGIKIADIIFKPDEGIVEIRRVDENPELNLPKSS